MILPILMTQTIMMIRMIVRYSLLVAGEVMIMSRQGLIPA
jgi:hypothetical protein